MEHYFREHERAQVARDVQLTIDRLDAIGEQAQRWLPQRKRLVYLGRKTRLGFQCHKVYVAIACRRLDPMRGARLYLAVDQEHRKVVFVSLIPKSEIAQGTKDDLSPQAEERLFDSDDV